MWHHMPMQLHPCNDTNQEDLMSDVPCTKIGFIGFGNMAKAIAKGLLRAEAVPAGNIYA